MTDELYKKNRPNLFKHVHGQSAAIKVLKGFEKANKIPHAICLHGPSGCGKTTLGRILQDKLDCSVADFVEINCADFKGVDTIRDIRTYMNLAPMNGKTRIWLIDEAHKLTNDAQNAFLKLLEDPPEHVYFILCTTDINKIIKTVQTRCTMIGLSAISDKDILVILNEVCKKEKIKIDKEVLNKIVELSENSARQALVLLDQVYNLPSNEQLEVLQKRGVKEQAITLVRALMKNPCKWADIKVLLKDKGLQDEEPESMRQMILGYARAILLNTDNPRASFIISAFEDSFFDAKNAASAKFVNICYMVSKTK